MKVQVQCKIGGDYHEETIECENYFIHEGAYIFVGKSGFGHYEFENVIKTYPVMFTIVTRIDEN